MSTVATIPDSTKNSLHWRLADRAHQRWPELTEVRMRHRAGFAYVDGVLADGQVLRLCRLRYLRSATTWGFAIHRDRRRGPRLRLRPLPQRPDRLDLKPPTNQRRGPLVGPGVLGVLTGAGVL